MLGIKNLNVAIQEVYDDVWLNKNISLSLLRLDTIHRDISGNKIFKLYYFLQKAIQDNLKIITFGGAYSNHLYATAAACSHYHLQCIGIIRGQEPAILSPTLSFCLQQGMHLEFISRADYDQKEESLFLQNLTGKYGEHLLIPEGGFSLTGVRGAAKICHYISVDLYTHICCPVGSATTLAGLIQAAGPFQKIIGFSALRQVDYEERLKKLLNNTVPQNYCMIESYHFGGYAKKTNNLISFMNSFYQDHLIPLDFVYTAKMMYGVIDLLKQNYFAEKSRVICIHTGGLQGNSSLMPGVLNY